MAAGEKKMGMVHNLARPRCLLLYRWDLRLKDIRTVVHPVAPLVLSRRGVRFQLATPQQRYLQRSRLRPPNLMFGARDWHCLLEISTPSIQRSELIECSR